MCEYVTRTTTPFLPADGEASCLLLPSSLSLLSGSTMQPENTCSCILKVTGQVSVYLSKVVSTDLTIKPDSVLNCHFNLLCLNHMEECET